MTRRAEKLTFVNSSRGPLIGPLVIAGFMADETFEENLRNMGVKDSKLLTPKQRDGFFDRLQKYGKFKILIISPQEVDAALGSDHLNLNWLEAQQSALIINELKPDKAVLDCPSPNIKKYHQYMKNIVYGETEIVVEHKADLNHPIVAAASILAKVTRDREIAKIQEDIDDPIGSGYLTDPITQEFIKKNYKKHPEIFRKSWVSYKKLVFEEDQSRLGDF